jgi:hypothetical protein
MRTSSVLADPESLDQSYKWLLNPHVYKVSVTEKLRALKPDLIKNHPWGSMGPPAPARFSRPKGKKSMMPSNVQNITAEGIGKSSFFWEP